MTADERPVDPKGRFEVDRLPTAPAPVALPRSWARRNRDETKSRSPGVTRQPAPPRGFDAEGNPNSLIGFGRSHGVFGRERVVPEPVEVQSARTRKPRAWIRLPSSGRRNRRAPRREDLAHGRLPSSATAIANGPNARTTAVRTNPGRLMRQDGLARQPAPSDCGALRRNQYRRLPAGTETISSRVTAAGSRPMSPLGWIATVINAGEPAAKPGRSGSPRHGCAPPLTPCPRPARQSRAYAHPAGARWPRWRIPRCGARSSDQT